MKTAMDTQNIKVFKNACLYSVSFHIKIGLSLGLWAFT